MYSDWGLLFTALQIFGFLAFMCTILAIGNGIWEYKEGTVFTAFLPRDEGVNASFSAFLTFWSYVIILNTVVPISLYVRWAPPLYPFVTFYVSVLVAFCLYLCVEPLFSRCVCPHVLLFCCSLKNERYLGSFEDIPVCSAYQTD